MYVAKAHDSSRKEFLELRQDELISKFQEEERARERAVQTVRCYRRWQADDAANEKGSGKEETRARHASRDMFDIPTFERESTVSRDRIEF